jgi:hypothetical protein
MAAKMVAEVIRMQPEQDPGDPERKSRLKSLIQDALDTVASTPDLPLNTAESIAEAILKRAPGPNEVADVVKDALVAAGEGAGQAAEAAGQVAEAIAEGLGSALNS